MAERPNWEPKGWRDWAGAAWVAYWDCDEGRENLLHDDLRDAVEYYVDDALSPGCDVAAIVREKWPDGLTVYGWERKEVASHWLHGEAEHLAERFAEDFDDEFGGDDPLVSNELEAELAAAFNAALDAVKGRLESWQCERVAEVTLTVEEVLEVLAEVSRG